MPRLTTAEVAERTGYPKRKIQRMVKAGKLKPTFVMPTNGAMLFDERVILRVFVAELSDQPPSL